jgi:hypothetical protein
MNTLKRGAKLISGRAPKDSQPVLRSVARSKHPRFKIEVQNSEWESCSHIGLVRGTPRPQRDSITAFPDIAWHDDCLGRGLIPDTAPGLFGFVGPVEVPADPPALLLPKPVFGLTPEVTPGFDGAVGN